MGPLTLTMATRETSAKKCLFMTQILLKEMMFWVLFYEKLIGTVGTDVKPCLDEVPTFFVVIMWDGNDFNGAVKTLDYSTVVIVLLKHNMLKNPNYQYGPSGVMVPMHLNYSQFILEKLLEKKERKWVNGATGESISYGEIAQQSMSVALSLSQLGARKGQTVAICSENRLEFWGAAIGSICTGATLTVFSDRYGQRELIHVANISKPQYIICSLLAYKMHEKTFRSLKDVKKIIVFGEDRPANTISFNELVSRSVRFEEFRVADVDGARDTLFVLYSSGTTGLPKGVMLTHLNVLICSCSPILTRTHLDKVCQLMPVPWYHALGFILSFTMMSKGFNIVFLPKFDTELALKCIQKYKITNIQAVPPMLISYIKHASKEDLSSVNVIYCGAAPITKDTLEAVKKIFPNVSTVHQGYGMTESTLGVMRDIGLSPSPKLGTVGPVAAGNIAKVVDLRTNQPLGPNQSGEICVKGGVMMKGYVGKDRREDFDDEGFFRTGDIGYYDQDGYFYIVERLKEMIKYNANQVAPAEIEAVLLLHPGVRDAGVVGVPHPGAGEVPRAFVALQPGASVSAEELQKFVAERLSNPKHLRGGVRFVEEVPKTPSGKILRRQLRTMVDSKL